MPSPPFDAAKAVTFDLSRGQIVDEVAGRRVLVPAAALFALCRAASPEAVGVFAREVGEAIGAAVARRFENAGTSAATASIDEVAEQLGGELSVAGFGVLAIERWGRALVLVIDHGPLSDGDKVLELLLAAAVKKATGLDAHCLRLVRDGHSARFLLTSQAAAEKVGEWLSAGTPWAEVLARLHPSRTVAGPS
jgi:hypothetical protein